MSAMMLRTSLRRLLVSGPSQLRRLRSTMSVPGSEAEAPSMFARVKKVVWSTEGIVVGCVALGCWCANFIYNHKQGSLLPPSPVNYMEKIEEATAIAQREKRRRLLRRMTTVHEQVTEAVGQEAGQSMSLMEGLDQTLARATAALGLAQPSTGEITEREAERVIAQALNVVKKIEGGKEAAAALQEVLDQGTQEDTAPRTKDDMTGGKSVFATV